ncbi:MAG TPA: DnaA/Hda family protein [Lacipirellulaceae bacterium]|nr:DnaA/Hda family protein [Lacipirellulaceae bacterium]
MRDALRRKLGADRYELWLGERTRLEFVGNTLRVVCASRAELQFLRRRIHRPLAECCLALWAPAPSIAFEQSADDWRSVQRVPATVGAAAGSGLRSPSRNVASPLTLPPAVAAPRVAPAADSAVRPSTARTFSNFAFGAPNQLAAQAARDLAQHPGRFSPLLIHGPAGSGKTHLLQAIEHEARASRGRVRVVSMTSEQFTSEFLDALSRRASPGFRHKMRSIDLLLLDDVQFLDNKRATLEELLYTIDALQGRHGQAVLTSDRPAAELAAFSPELASRLGGGLAVALEQPDYAVRLGVVRSMAERMQAPLSDEVLVLVARQVVGSARLLAGAINRLVAAGMAAGHGVTLELAEQQIAEFCRQHAPQVRLPDIQRVVCELFGVDAASLRSPRKNRAAAQPRMLCMWLARRYTRAALSEIGEFFGGRSHSTVVSAKRKFDGLISAGGEVVIGDRPCQVDEAVRRLEARLRTG